MKDLRQAAQQALEACEQRLPLVGQRIIIDELNALRAALAEPEQEPVVWVLITPYGEEDDICYTKPEAVPDGWSYKPLYYAAPPQREHITDGSPCWCNPDVIEEAGGNVIVHNYEDNWQQYAKPGETAQQCIERHRAEQDALMKLYATPRKPVELTDDEIALIVGECAASAHRYCDFSFARAVIAAYEAKNGITGETK